MIKIIKSIPKDKFAIACSGGIDSMVFLDFLLKGKYNPDILYFNHNTKHGDEAEKFIINFCNKKGLNLIIGRTDIKPTSNKEKQWSDARYNFFKEYKGDVITCHHLNDCVETYIFTMLRGFKSTIPYRKKNVIRPFLLTSKKDINDWQKRHNVEFIEDDSNLCLDFSRNRIRHNIVPECLKVSPGLLSIVKKEIIKSNE